jgi:hypothetical protein
MEEHYLYIDSRNAVIVPDIQLGMTLNRMHQLPVYADDVNLTKDNAIISKKGPEALKNVCLKVVAGVETDEIKSENIVKRAQRTFITRISGL